MGIPNEIIDELKNIVGAKWVVTDAAGMEKYLHEQCLESFEFINQQPEKECVVAKPGSPEEISQIMKCANAYRIPVIPKGGGSGLSGNAVPLTPSIILPLERMNRILELDEENLLLTCEAAVTLGDIVAYMGKHEKLHFPLHPGEEGAQIGGMAAMNAGGVRAIRHGVMRNQVTGLEAVLPTGEIVRHGGKDGKLVKDNTGYSLINLLIGNEGTLGIITRVTLRLQPESNANATLLVSYENRAQAFKSVPRILQEGVIPMAIEYVERDQAIKTAKDLGKVWPATEGHADLIFIMAEDSEDSLYEKCEIIDEICEAYGSVNILMAESRQEQRAILDIRSHVLPSVDDEIVDNLDITVPRGSLEEIIARIDELAEKYQTRIPTLAHAGDGNLHPFILKENEAVPAYYDTLKREIYQSALDLGGTITGEHGIGFLRKDMMRMQLSEKEIEIMQGIKKIYDPNNILNPGKVVDL